jgi:hypothetical protein
MTRAIRQPAHGHDVAVDASTADASIRAGITNKQPATIEDTERGVRPSVINRFSTA